MRFSFKLACGVVLGATGFIWFASTPLNHDTPTQPRPIGSSNADSNPTKIDILNSSSLAIPEYLLVDKSIKTNLQRIRNRQVDEQMLFANDEAMEQARLRVNLFKAGVTPEDAARSVLANEHRLNDNRIWFSYDMLVLGSRAEGDKFALHVPDLGIVQAEIERVDKLHGQYRWSGQIVNQPDSQFFITQVFSDQYAIGLISTAQGQYQLEAKSGTGWIANSKLEFRLPPDGLDGLDPEDPKHKH